MAAIGFSVLACVPTLPQAKEKTIETAQMASGVAGDNSPATASLGKDVRLTDDTQADVGTGTNAFSADGFNLDSRVIAGHAQI